MLCRVYPIDKYFEIVSNKPNMQWRGLKGFDKVWLYRLEQPRRKDIKKREKIKHPVVIIKDNSRKKVSENYFQYQKRYQQLKKYSHELQLNSTECERLLSNALRKRFRKLSIDREVVYMLDDKTAYIVDICILKKKIGIEIDGYHHYNNGSQRQYDLIRDEQLYEKFGLRILRVTNNDVLNHLDDIINHIRKIMSYQREIKPQHGIVEHTKL